MEIKSMRTTAREEKQKLQRSKAVEHHIDYDAMMSVIKKFVSSDLSFFQETNKDVDPELTLAESILDSYASGSSTVVFPPIFMGSDDKNDYVKGLQKAGLKKLKYQL